MGSWFRSFLADRRGNVALIFALALPVLGGAAAAAVDLNTWWAAKQRLQRAVDGAALAAAREFQLASTQALTVSTTADAYVRNSLASQGPEPMNVETTANAVGRSVTVMVRAQVSPILSRIISDQVQYISATATARLSSGAPVCLLGLDPNQPGTLTFKSKSRLSADSCGVYSNSSDRAGLTSGNGASAFSALFCTHGGFQNSGASFSPAPVTDCPALPDPLVGRVPPQLGVLCTATNLTISKVSRTLQPGTYCGGLKITNKADVTLMPGIYVIKDGPFVVDGKSTLTGSNAGLYFFGDKTSVLFDKDSTISLSAPKDGPMAGILMTEDPAVVAPVPAPDPTDPDLLGIVAGLLPPLPLGAPKMREYRIISDNARQLLGTIYLPNGRLVIDSKKAVADQSAYTVIVVRRLELYDGPNLHLNANYAATDVPVPAGVGPVGGKATLTR